MENAKKLNSIKRNVKKVLALVLAFACAFTMFAGAAFTDTADIEHAKAVDMLTSLGVIDGYEDGSFRPDATITRAEMAKMIFTIRNGGNDDASAYAGVSTSFTDINGHWAEGYIKYCQINGIISGKSATKFDPEGQVTVVETAKMALVLMGYKEDRANLSGTGWDSRTLALATDNSLLDGVVGGVSAPIIRDEAAQLLYNTVNAKCVLWSNDKETFIDDTFTVGSGQSAYVNTYTVGTKYLGLQEWIGTFVGNDKTGATSKDGYIVVNGALDGNGNKKDAAFEYDFDIKYIGEEVSVLFKDVKGGTNDVLDDKDYVYGVYVTGNTDVYNITKNDLQKADSGKIKFGDKNYDAAGSIKVYTNYADTATKVAGDFTEGATYAKQSGDTIKFVTDGNGDIFAAYVTESKITKVTAVNASSVSLKGVGALDFEDHEIYDGIAKDDVVVYTKLYNTDTAKATFVVTKAETVTGTLDSYKNSVDEITVDGTVYKVNNKALVDDLTDDAVTTFSTGDLGESVTLYMINGFVGAVDLAASSSNYALITDTSDSGTIGGINAFQIKVLLADGTEKIVSIDEDSAYDATGDGTNDTPNKTHFTTGEIVKYASISDSNVMDVTAVNCGASATTAGYDKDTKTFDGTMTTADAVLFVKVTDTSTDYYVYNIRTLGNIAANADGKKIVDDGKVVAAYVALASKPSGATSDTVYGIVTGGGNTVKVGDEYKNAYTVANDQASYTVYLPTSASLTKGNIVAFEKASDDIYAAADVKVLANGAAAVDGTAYVAYIDEMDGEDVLSYFTGVSGNDATGYTGTGSKTYALDDDCKIVYVDQDNDAAGSNIGINEFDGVKGYANAIVVIKDSKIQAIIIESSGKCNIL